MTLLGMILYLFRYDMFSNKLSFGNEGPIYLKIRLFCYRALLTELFIVRRTKQSKIGHDNPARTTEKLTSKCAKPVF